MSGMEHSVLSGESGAAVGSISVSEKLSAAKYNEPLIHQVVTAYLAGSRAGAKVNKSRSQVRGGGAKPWRQKGMGRARAGTSSSPLWRGGGVTFAASGTRNYGQKVNKKMYQGALRSIFAELGRQQRLIIVDGLPIKEPKTRLLATRLQALGVEDVLIVVEDVEESLFLAARNLSHVEVCDVAAVDPVGLISYDKIVLTKGALGQLEQRLS